MSREPKRAAEKPATVETSEQRAADLVVERFGDTFRFDASRGRFLVYARGRWIDDPGEAQVSTFVRTIAAETRSRLIKARVAEKEAERTARDLQSAAGLRAVKSHLKTTLGIVVTGDKFDVDPFALNCRNGTIDLRTGRLIKHDPADLITKQCPTDFDPNAPWDTWRSHLDRIFNGDKELIAYVQRSAGLYASGDIGVEELHVWYGDGANGKSKTFEAIKHVLGDYADMAPEGLLVARGSSSEHPTEIAGLLGKRFVIASETENSGKLRIAQFKRLTGDETLKARFMRQDFFEFPRTHKLLLVTNRKPKIEEDSEAVWRRLRLIPFDVKIPDADRDEDLKQKLVREASGILAWIVRGSIERINRGGMRPPKAVLAATESYRHEAGHFDAFASDMLVASGDPSDRLLVMEVVDLYASWRVQAAEVEEMQRAELYASTERLPGVCRAEWKMLGRKVRGFRGLRGKSEMDRAAEPDEEPGQGASDNGLFAHGGGRVAGGGRA